MRILVALVSLLSVISIIAYAQSTGPDGAAPSTRPSHEVPNPNDIFAITRWSQARPITSIRDLERLAPLDATTKPGTTPTTLPKPVWFAIYPQDKYWQERFQVTDNELREMLRTYHRVTPDQWSHGYSHVAGGDLGGWLILNDGTSLQWMMKPGNLAWLRFADGQMIYLASSVPHERP